MDNVQDDTGPAKNVSKSRDIPCAPTAEIAKTGLVVSEEKRAAKRVYQSVLALEAATAIDGDNQVERRSAIDSIVAVKERAAAK